MGRGTKTGPHVGGGPVTEQAMDEHDPGRLHLGHVPAWPAVPNAVPVALAPVPGLHNAPFVVPTAPQDPMNTAFVANLPEALDEPTVRAVFSVCGAVVRVKRLMDPQNKPRASAFVEFGTRQQAETAKQLLEGAPLMHGGKGLQLRIEEPAPGTGAVPVGDGERVLEELRRVLIGKRLLSSSMGAWIERSQRRLHQQERRPRERVPEPAPAPAPAPIQRRATSYEDVLDVRPEPRGTGATGDAVAQRAVARERDQLALLRDRERRWELREAEFFARAVHKDRERDEERAAKRARACEELRRAPGDPERPPALLLEHVGLLAPEALAAAWGLGAWAEKRARMQAEEDAVIDAYLGRARAGAPAAEQPGPAPLIPLEEDISSLADLVRKFPELSPAEQIARFQAVEERKLRVLVEERVPARLDALVALPDLPWPEFMQEHCEGLLLRLLTDFHVPGEAFIPVFRAHLGDFPFLRDFLQRRMDPRRAECFLCVLWRWMAVLQGAAAHKLNLLPYLK